MKKTNLQEAAEALVAAADGVIAEARRTRGQETEARAAARIRYTAALDNLRAALEEPE